MKRSIIANVIANEARHILLVGDDVPGRVRFLSRQGAAGRLGKAIEGDNDPDGHLADPRYGNFAITPDMLAQMVSDFHTASWSRMCSST